MDTATSINSIHSQPAVYDRNHPFHAPFLENLKLNLEGSSKDTRHQVFGLESSGLTYRSGDSLGVFAENPDSLVGELLSKLRLSGDEPVLNQKGESVLLKELLTRDYLLNRVSKKFIRLVAGRLPAGARKDELEAMIADNARLDEYIFARDYVDVLNEFGQIEITAGELVDSLVKAAPRLYSIASSPKKYPTQVHLTVAVVSYTTFGRSKHGFASGYLAHHLPIGASAPVYVQPSRHFHLPASDADIIMIGPGTGIAPFRAFLQEREVDGASGRNWLFFGDQHRASDFLYGEEFLEYQRRGLLTRLDLAFSRDQAHKVYVQNRMREEAREIWRWLQNGAYLYVCGDAHRMAKDVHQTLIDIAETEGKLSAQAAAEYVNQTLMKTEKRYLRDVY